MTRVQPPLGWPYLNHKTYTKREIVPKDWFGKKREALLAQNVLNNRQHRDQTLWKVRPAQIETSEVTQALLQPELTKNCSQCNCLLLAL